MSLYKLSYEHPVLYCIVQLNLHTPHVYSYPWPLHPNPLPAPLFPNRKEVLISLWEENPRDERNLSYKLRAPWSLPPDWSNPAVLRSYWPEHSGLRTAIGRKKEEEVFPQILANYMLSHYKQTFAIGNRKCLKYQFCVLIYTNITNRLN